MTIPARGMNLETARRLSMSAHERASFEAETLAHSVDAALFESAGFGATIRPIDYERSEEPHRIPETRAEAAALEERCVDAVCEGLCLEDRSLVCAHRKPPRVLRAHTASRDGRTSASTKPVRLR